MVSHRVYAHGAGLVFLPINSQAIVEVFLQSHEEYRTTVEFLRFPHALLPSTGHRPHPADAEGASPNRFPERFFEVLSIFTRCR